MLIFPLIFPIDYFCFIGENDFFGKCTVVVELVVDPAG